MVIDHSVESLNNMFYVCFFMIVLWISSEQYHMKQTSDELISCTMSSLVERVIFTGQGSCRLANSGHGTFYNNVNVLLYGSDNQGTLAPR